VKISADHIWNELTALKYWEDQKSEPNPLRQWDFYCTVGRRVERARIDGDARVVLPQRLNLPAAGSALSPPWHRLTVPGYQDVHWRNEMHGNKLVCNGILVWDKSEDYLRRDWAGQGIVVLRPTISVFDPDGRFPLNLPRTDLADRQLPFADALWESQCEDYIAWMLANAPSRPLVGPSEAHPEYRALVYPSPRLTFAFTRAGSVPIELWAFQQLSPSRVIFAPSTMKVEVAPGTNELLVPLNLKWAGSDARRVWFRCTFGWNIREGLSPFDAFRPRGRRTIIETDFYNYIRKPGMVARTLWEGVRVEASNKRWTILSSADCERGRIDFASLLSSPAPAGIGGLTEYSGVSLNEHAEEVPAWATTIRGQWPLAKVWRKFTEGVVIPYDLRRRRREYARAYDKFGSTIQYYEGLRKDKADKEK
jgi:hypothetical protein